jgi:hypothetical protein
VPLSIFFLFVVVNHELLGPKYVNYIFAFCNRFFVLQFADVFFLELQFADVSSYI